MAADRLVAWPWALHSDVGQGFNPWLTWGVAAVTVLMIVLWEAWKDRHL